MRSYLLNVYLPISRYYEGLTHYATQYNMNDAVVLALDVDQEKPGSNLGSATQLLCDLGPLALSQPSLPHRVAVRTEGGKEPHTPL